MGKFDFDEMDSAIQNAESKRQYEQQTEFLNKKIELIQELHDSIGIYIEEVRNLVIAVRAIISDINKASTIKCPSNLKSLLDNYANETCIDVTKKMNAEATKVVSRISAMEKRKALPESLFYVLMISAILAQQQKSVEWKTLSKDISNSEHKKWHVLYTSDLCSECFHL